MKKTKKLDLKPLRGNRLRYTFAYETRQASYKTDARQQWEAVEQDLIDSINWSILDVLVDATYSRIRPAVIEEGAKEIEDLMAAYPDATSNTKAALTPEALVTAFEKISGMDYEHITQITQNDHQDTPFFVPKVKDEK